LAINYKKCPKCGSKNSVAIVYGMPNYKLGLEAEAGKVKLGGCEITLGNAEYCCKDCGHEWNREQAIDAAYRKLHALAVVDCLVRKRCMGLSRKASMRSLKRSSHNPCA
jgi:DNA-directed RNA polymerase subunit RPC12/RpoP